WERLRRLQAADVLHVRRQHAGHVHTQRVAGQRVAALAVGHEVAERRQHLAAGPEAGDAEPVRGLVEVAPPPGVALLLEDHERPAGVRERPRHQARCCVVTTLTTSKRSPTVSRGGTLERVATWSGPFAGGAAGAGADAASAIVSS